MSGDSPLSPGSSGALRRPRLDADGITAAGDDGLSAGDAKRVSAALEASSAPNTAKAYRAALNRFAEWLAGRPATDATVAAYVAALMDDGYAPATIKQAAAAIGAGARAQGRPDPRGPLARQALAGAVRRNAGEGRGQVAGLRREDALAAAATWTSEGRYEGPLFRRVTRTGAVSGHAPLTTNAVRAVVRKRSAAVGVEGASGHSCRVGSAQSLIERGASTAAVAIAGRWKDPGMVVRYAKAQEAGRGAVKVYFGGK